MAEYAYHPRQNVKAFQWREDNLDEAKQVLRTAVERDQNDEPYVYIDYVEPYFLTHLGERGGYYILQFDHLGDSFEVEPGRWVVVYDDGDVEVMDDDEFHKRFEKVS